MESTKGFGGFECFFGVKILASNSMISEITICLKLFTNDSIQLNWIKRFCRAKH